MLVLLNDPHSLDLSQVSIFSVRVWTRVSATDISNSSFIQMQYDLFNGQRHAASAPLAVSDDGVASLSKDVSGHAPKNQA